MKVMLVSHSSAVNGLGGAELTLLDLIDQWREFRPDVEFFVVARTPEGLMQPEFERRGIEHRSIDFDSWVLPLVRERPIDVIMTARMDSHAVTAIAGWIREFQPDLVVTNTIVSPWAALAAKMEGVAHAWMVHEFGDLDHGLGFRIGREQTFEDIGLLSELVVANSEAVRDHVGQWVDREKLMIAYPANDLKRARELALEVEPRVEAVSGPLRAVMVGRLGPTKGQWRLLEAMAVLRDEGVDVSATLVGAADPQDELDIRRLIADRDLTDRVTIVGETTNPFVHMAAADVGVMASNCEAFGRVTVEYLALGLPVVASRSGANPELVAEGETGWLFDPDDVGELVDALREADADRGELARRGAEAKRSVDSRIADAYPIEDLITRFEAVAEQGAGPVERLPHVTREWLVFPTVVEQYFDEMATIREAAHASATWRVGNTLMRPFRVAARVLGRG